MGLLQIEDDNIECKMICLEGNEEGYFFLLTCLYCLLGNELNLAYLEHFITIRKYLGHMTNALYVSTLSSIAPPLVSPYI